MDAQRHIPHHAIPKEYFKANIFNGNDMESTPTKRQMPGKYVSYMLHTPKNQYENQKNATDPWHGNNDEDEDDSHFHLNSKKGKRKRNLTFFEDEEDGEDSFSESEEDDRPRLHSKNKKKRKRRRVARLFTSDEFIQLMHLTQKDAAKEMGVCLSTFKRQFSSIRPKMSWPSPTERRRIAHRRIFEEIIAQNTGDEVKVKHGYKLGEDNDLDALFDSSNFYPRYDILLGQINMLFHIVGERDRQISELEYLLYESEAPSQSNRAKYPSSLPPAPHIPPAYTPLALPPHHHPAHGPFSPNRMKWEVKQETENTPTNKQHDPHHSAITPLSAVSPAELDHHFHMMVSNQNRHMGFQRSSSQELMYANNVEDLLSPRSAKFFHPHPPSHYQGYE